MLCLPFVASAASVLCCLTLVPDIICPGMYTCVFWIGAMFCDRLPFHRCVVSWFQTVRHQSSLLLRCSPASRLLRFVPCILIAIRLLHFLPSSITSDELRLLAQTYEALIAVDRSVFFFLRVYSKSHHGGIFTHGPSFSITIVLN